MPRLDHFDLLAPLYDRLISPPDAALFASLVGLPTSGLLLDAGGGTGRVAQQIKHMARAVVVADASRAMLAQAGDKAGLLPVACEVEALPLPGGAFARVIMVDAFHHLRDQTGSLHELWRVVAPGGRLVIEEPDIRRTAVKLVALAEKLLLMRSHFQPAERLAEGLQRLGAQVRIHREGHTAWVIGEKRA